MEQVGVPNQYNISFTVIGDYISISEFIYAIEKNPNLGFRIEEFALVSYSTNSLQGTFIIKNIAIDPNSLSSSSSNSVTTGTVTDNQKAAQTSTQPTNEGDGKSGASQTGSGKSNS